MRGILSAGIGGLGRAGFIIAATLLGGIASADAASVNLSWTAPTTNADGSPLRDLAGYRIYLGTAAPACPGASAHAVTAPGPAPGSAQTVSRRITGLTASTTYFARVTAVDTAGNESRCSSQVSGSARADVAVIPTATVGFGSVATGAAADRTFTVQNTGAATVAGTASVGAPFAVVSGGSFSIAPGASRAVVVRFRPTTAGTFAANATFRIDGETQSRALSGTATGSSTSAPPAAPEPTGSLRVFVTRPRSGATVGGSGTAVLWVEGTSGSSNTFTLSVDGVTTGSQRTSTRGPVTLPWTSIADGTRRLTATVRDASGKTGSTSVSVRVAGNTAGVPPAPAPPPPAASPSSDTLDVFITQPTGGATVRGTASVVMWVEGSSGSSNTFTLSVDGATVGSQTTSARGPVTIPWTSGAGGSHTLTAVVRDARGNIGRASITVTERN